MHGPDDAAPVPPALRQAGILAAVDHHHEGVDSPGAQAARLDRIGPCPNLPYLRRALHTSINGKPGVRADYGPKYYAAFAIDPDGYRIEAYCGK